MSDAEATQIAYKLGVEKKDVIEMNTRLTGKDVALVSDSSDDENYAAPINWLADEDHTPERMMEKKSTENIHTKGIEEALDSLDDRSRRIIETRWLCDSEDQLTLHDLAAEFGISAERVRQVEVKAMQKMRGSLEKFMN